MIAWILAHPYLASAIFYAFLITGVCLFVRGAADREVSQ